MSMPAAHPPDRQRRLDRDSAATLVRFTLCMLMVLAWYAAWRWGGGHGASLMMMAGAAQLSIAVVACLRRERPLAPSLNRWDEAAAWLGIAFLARALAL
jgi:hypothetical protein